MAALVRDQILVCTTHAIGAAGRIALPGAYPEQPYQIVTAPVAHDLLGIAA